MKTTLYYVYDPMCVWCYGFCGVWNDIQKKLPSSIDVKYILGGLAPDTDALMPIKTKEYVQKNWHQVSISVPNTVLNFDFWHKNTPRRATYPACRAIILARHEGKEVEMLAAIQKAYYQDAKNPSEPDVLANIASNITALGKDREKFITQLNHSKTQDELISDIDIARSIGGNSFPALILQKENSFFSIPYNYSNADITLAAIHQHV